MIGSGSASSRETPPPRTHSAARRTGKLRLAALALIALFPPFLKRPCYRLFFGYRIGKRVRIGLSILDARQCTLADDVYIGHGNLVIGVEKFTAGAHARICHFNILRGGDEISIAPYAEVIRFNVINSIIEPDLDPSAVLPAEPRFSLGRASIVVAGHKIDFTDRVEIGERTILGGRNSSLWTHNRQRTKPIRVGSYCYLGSEIRMCPGATVPSRCIVGIGSVIVGELQGENNLIAGVPAKPVKPLDADDLFLIEHKTRPDLPD